MATADQKYKYSSMGGVDISLVLEGKIVGEAQAISVAIQREKGPIHTLGKADARAFARGKRGIAGTMIYPMLNEHLLYKDSFNTKEFIADKDELKPTANGDFTDTANDLVAVDATFAGNVAGITDGWAISKVWYMDQVLPIDAVLVGQSEYGIAAEMRIYQLEWLNEGTGVSIDDMMIEHQSTYVALSVAPWRRIGAWDFDNGDFVPA